MMNACGPVVLFDGTCNLCHGTVRWIVKRDRRGLFRFASLQSSTAESLLRAAGRGPDRPNSVVLLDERGLHTESDAILGILARLDPPWRWLVIGRLIPKFVRDRLYRFVARHRYRWFGQREECPVPSPELRARFLDSG